MVHERNPPNSSPRKPAILTPSDPTPVRSKKPITSEPLIDVSGFPTTPDAGGFRYPSMSEAKRRLEELPALRHGLGRWESVDTQASASTMRETQQSSVSEFHTPLSGRKDDDFNYDSNDDDRDLDAQSNRKGRVQFNIPLPKDVPLPSNPGSPIDEPTEWAYGHRSFQAPRRLSARRHSFVTLDLRLAHQQDPETSEELLTLFHDDNDGEISNDNIIASVKNGHGLKDTMSGLSDQWFAVLCKYTDIEDAANSDLTRAEAMLEAAKESNAQAQLAKAEINKKNKEYLNKLVSIEQKLTGMRDYYEAQRKVVADQEGKLEKSRNTILRLRRERDESRENASTLRSTMDELKEKLEEYEDTIRQLRTERKGRKKPSREVEDTSESESSDDEQTATTRKSRAATPHSIGGDSSASYLTKSEPRYPDISTFKGSADENIERWIASAETKFRKSYASFPEEWDKIEYLRDHTADAAWEVINYRALHAPEGERYSDRKQLYEDLQEAFGVVDKQGAVLQDLRDGKLNQKADEALSAWLSRFNNAIVYLHLDDASKAFWALNCISKRFKGAAVNGAPTGETWLQLQTRLREVELRQRAAYGKEKDKERTSKGSGNPTTKSSSSRKSEEKKDRPYDEYHRPISQFNIIKKKGLCARCLKPGHTAKDDKAPCKGQKKVAWKEDLASIEVAELDAPPPASEPAEN